VFHLMHDSMVSKLDPLPTALFSNSYSTKTIPNGNEFALTRLFRVKMLIFCVADLYT
jgi:hypothetical protein